MSDPTWDESDSDDNNRVDSENVNRRRGDDVVVDDVANASTTSSETPLLVGAEADDALRRGNELKQRGNEFFTSGKFDDAVLVYGEAIAAVRHKEFKKERSIYLCNRAACFLALKRHADAERDCSEAVTLDPSYVKAYMRRATAHEALEQFVAAHTDYAKVVELDPAGSAAAAAALKRVAPLADQERERQKEEMLGKLKDLGNSLLGRFGLSLDNFAAQQDPATGSYSINFKQK